MMKSACLFIFSIISAIAVQISADVGIQDSSLLHKTWKKYSQSGEEGVLDTMLQRMGIENGFFIEFGASDGKFYSNTRFLAERGWKGAWIECSDSCLPALYETGRQFPNVMCINQFITANTSDKRGLPLDVVADQNFPNEEIDVLSIDIDGHDYLIFEGLKHNPKIICIESSGYWSPFLKTRVPDEIAGLNLGQPLHVMTEIARKHGYEPVCFLTVNLFLVRKDYYYLFSDIKNDAETLWLESWTRMGEKQDYDKSFIRERRRTSSIIQMYDPYVTP